MAAHMADSGRIGIAFSGGASPSEIVDCVRLAESLGYESAWVAEGHGGDQFAVLAACAARTSRILLGTSITSVFVRTAPTIAMAALSVDDLSCGRARFRLARLPEEVGEAADAETIATALGLQPNEIGFEDFRPSLWSAGISFPLVPVRDLAAIRRCKARLDHWQAAFTRHGRSSVFCLLSRDRRSRLRVPRPHVCAAPEHLRGSGDR